MGGGDYSSSQLDCENHSQERQPPWGSQNLGDSIFHCKRAYKSKKKTKSLGTYAQVSFGVLKFVHYWGRRDNFDKGDRSKNKKGPKVH